MDGTDVLATYDVVDNRSARDMGSNVSHWCATGRLTVFVAEVCMTVNDEVDIVLVDHPAE